MKLTVDCVLSGPQLHLPSNSALVQLLSVSNYTLFNTPLEALVAQQYGFTTPDNCPLAAIAAHADGLEPDNFYWLRADPVHLVLQRDSFSLGEPVPLQLEATQALQMIATLNAHFMADNLTFHIGNSGAWYLRSPQSLNVTTCLPSAVIGRNIHAYQPQGEGAAKFRAVINEIQMLLHAHPANIARESLHQLAVNSIWFSGGGYYPMTPQNKHENSTLTFSDSVLFQGLAKHAGVLVRQVPQTLASLILSAEGCQQVRLTLNPSVDTNEVWFSAMLAAVKQRKIKQIALNLGFYESTLCAEINYASFIRSRLMFWQTVKPIEHYFS